MKSKSKLNYCLLIVFILVISISGCSQVSYSKNKETGVETSGGIVSSKDFYSLLIQKEYDPNNPNNPYNYVLILHAASKVRLSESLIKSKGIFELLLANGQVLIIENVECLNDPLGFGGAIAFSVKTTEENIRTIYQNPIIKIKAFGILETEFSPKMQSRLQEIIASLL
jgi:hypothetical protein